MERPLLDDSSRYLLKAGFIRVIDIIFILGIITGGIIGFYRETMHVLGITGLAAFLWVGILQFRTMSFTLEARREVTEQIAEITDATARKVLKWSSIP